MPPVPASPQVCPKCGGEMEEGFVLDNPSDGHQSGWVEGAPEGSRWTGIKMKGKVQLPVVAYRCQLCGFLESYAPSA